WLLESDRQQSEQRRPQPVHRLRAVPLGTNRRRHLLLLDPATGEFAGCRNRLRVLRLPVRSTAGKRCMTEREQFVAEALSWVGTPYHLGAMVKGAGCDCGTFLLGVLKACGNAEDERVERFTDDWLCHTHEERYLRAMLRNAAKVTEAISYPTLLARPGDLALTHSSNSKLYNHAGIVLQWPRVIHAIAPCVAVCNATAHELWAFRTVTVFDPFMQEVPC